MKSSTMSRSRRYAALAGSALVLSLTLGGVQAQESVSASEEEGDNRWFVELNGMPVADGASLAGVQSEQDAFRRNAAAAGVVYEERLSYDVLFNGFSIEASAAERAKISRLPGVKALYPVEIVQAPNPEKAGDMAPDIARAVDLTGAKVAQTQFGLTGKGIKVGIVDTGIDIDHPAFGGTGVPGTTSFPSTRVVAGWDFVGDNYNSSGTGAALVPVPDPVPDDCNGHGTHVSGITGANGGGFTGVAPGVSFGVYRVFGCTGTSSSDVIVAALERAYLDGMQVINQSLGAARQWPQYPTAQASTRLARSGVVMVASIGNNGPGGSSPDALFAAGAPGVGDRVIGVASFDNAQPAFTVDGTPYGYNSATGSPLPATAGDLPLARTGTTTTANDACAALPAGSLAGTAVLIRRGTCSFYIKAANAQNAGAAAVILYNNQAGALNATVAGTPAITIPVVGVTQAQGATLDALIAGGPTTLAWTASTVSYPYGTGGLISGFSSFGLAADLSFKPQLGAPGGGIYAPYPLELGGAATLSGTSMSSPHVAGGVALIMEGRPGISASAMQTRLQNSADPKNWSGSPGLGFLDFSFRQGAGMLDIVGTLESSAVVEPSQLAVGESQAGPKTFTIKVRSESNKTITYDLTHVPALASGPNTQTGASYNTTGTFDAPASVTLSTQTLTVPAGSKASFSVTIDANAELPDRSLYGGYIVLTPQGGGAAYRVPYAGFKGDYQSTQVVTPTANGFPWLAQLSGGSYLNRPEGATYTMAGDDIPYFLVHLDHLSSRVIFEAFQASTGKYLYIVSDDEYFTRNSTPGGFFAFGWDGSTFEGKGSDILRWHTVPNGQYVVRMRVLKALGNRNNPADWESWTSPVITIARP